MPTKEEHLIQAERNEKLAATLAHTQYTEWTVTVLFYAAVHYIEAFLAVRQIHCDQHSERNEYVRKIPQLRTIGREYLRLRTISRQARYYAQPITGEDVRVAQENLNAIAKQIKYVMTGKRD